MRWNFQRRTDLWKFNNAVTRAAGGEDCAWMGMIGGELLYNSNRFIDLQQILPEAAIVMLDHQRRNAFDGFEQNTEAGKRLHEIAGWDKLIPESMPQYQLGSPAFRLASMPPRRCGSGRPPASPAASSPGGTISARCTRTGGSTGPPSRSSDGTPRTRACWSTAP